MNAPKRDDMLVEDQITQEAMLAYATGTLSAEESARFEKLLEGDPFAKEALEGVMSVTSPASLDAVLTATKAKVRERSGLSSGKAATLNWVNYAWAAALVLLLLGVGSVMVFYFGGSGNQLAKTEATDQEQPVVVSDIKVHAPLTDSVAEATGTSEVQSLSANDFDVQTNDVESANAEKDRADAQQQSAIHLQAGDANGINSVSGNSSSLKFEEGKRKAESPENSLRNADKVASDYAYSNRPEAPSQSTDNRVVRGSIMEKEDVPSEEIITLDDAMKNFNSGNYKKASEQFDAILRVQPSNVEALYYGGISDYINGSDKKSERNFDKLLKSGSKYTDGSKWYKANLLLRKGKKTDAVKLLDELSSTNNPYKERALKKRAEIKL